MFVIPRSAPRWPLLALVGLLCLAGLPTLAPRAALASTDLDLGGTALVAYTNGDPVLLRAAAGYDADVLFDVPEGTTVQVLDGPSWAADGSAWYLVVVWGQTGYMDAGYLARPDAVAGAGTQSQSQAAAEDPTAAAADVPVPDEPVVAQEETAAVGGLTAAAVVGTGTITGTNGDGVRCRSDAGYWAGVITVLAEGSTVELTGTPVGEWQPVNCAGQGGFVHSSFVASGGDSSNAVEEDTFAVAAVVTGTMVVSGTGGSGVRCRSWAGYDASVITVLAEGTQVSVTGAATGEWQPVVCAGTNGFVHTAFLASSGSNTGTNPTPSAAPTPVPTTGGLGSGDHAVTTASLNLRYDASYGAGVAAVAPAGTVVAITGGAVNGFYPVNWDGLYGYMFGGYLSWTDAALSERGGSASPGDDGGGAGNSGGTATGNMIANFALQYVGYPYVWAGEGPYGFDCSGFVMFVIRNTLGLEITHDMFIQYDMGTPVAYGDLQPGDIVFFQNTFRWGMSHNGIYIGNNQFVHAENENTGVRISDITSQYYSSRYYGAVRFR